ncbi:MAG: selenium cofactor biosynthesis protein YqeC [Salinirussus sp.]
MDLDGALGLGEAELVAFVGAGGKKTAMSALVEAAGGRGLDAGYTTTTHTPPPPELPLVLAGETDLLAALAGVDPPVAFAAERVTDPDRADRKVSGHGPDAVSAAFADGPFDWVLVKADGARRREFKAPGPGEPIVPAAATRVVPVASVRAVGEPLAAPTVHRPERVAAIAGIDAGETITPETVGAVLGSPDGGLKRVPDGAAVTPVVNKADTPTLRDRARVAVREALARSDRLSRGAVTSFETGYCEIIG